MNVEESEKKATELGVTIFDSAVDLFTKIIPDLSLAIPPAAIVNSFYKVVVAVREENLLKRLHLLAKQMNDLSSKEVEQFYEQIKTNPQDFAKKMVLTIDRLDEDEKAIIIGNLTKARIRLQIQEDEYLRLINVVNKVYLPDLKLLYLFKKDPNEKFIADTTWSPIDMQIVEANLFPLGLLTQTVSKAPASSGIKSLVLGPQKILYGMSKLGEILIVVGLDGII